MTSAIGTGERRHVRRPARSPARDDFAVTSPRLITDLDGTLLRNDRSAVCRTIAALAAAGRPESGLLRHRAARAGGYR